MLKKIKITKSEIADCLFILVLISTTMLPFQIFIPLNIFQWFIILLFIYLFLFSKLYINTSIIILIFILVLSTLLSVYQYSLLTKIKNIIGVTVTAVALLSYVRNNSDNLTRIIRMYVKIMVYAAILGIMQELAYIINIEWLADANNYGIVGQYSFAGSFMRVRSIASEPAHFAYMLFPIVYFAIKKLFEKDKNNTIVSTTESLIVIIALLLTFSLIAYIGLVFIVVYIGYKKSLLKFLKYAFLMLLFMFLVIRFNPSLREKANSILDVRRNFQSTANLSAFAVYSNALVAWSTFKDNIFFGTGVNSFGNNYEKYIGEYFPREKITMELNKEDAASLFLRIPAEFGLLGIIFAILFMCHFKIQKNNNNLLGTFNEAFFIAIILYALRSGTYLSPYLWFFVGVYRQSYMEFRKQLVS